jgi:hypothetical protein
VSLRDWIAVQKMLPRDPRDLIADASTGGTQGSFKFSGNFLDAGGGGWSTTPISVSTKPVVETLGTDNDLLVANADQWNFDHLTWNLSSNLPQPLQNHIFVRGGAEWVNHINLAVSGSPIQEIQMSFLINAGTRGGMQGQVPVIYWDSGSWSGNVTLDITLRSMFGMHHIGLWAFDGTNISMYDLALIVVP